jgi:CheY-like chemotaxis protein
MGSARAHLQAQCYDLILCDLRMPELDGHDFYECLRWQDASLCQRVLFLTGALWDVDSQTFLAQCGQPWLAKPCHTTEVHRAIQQILAP